MKKICLMTLILFVCASASAALPACHAFGARSGNCVGSFTDANGDTYTGEWQADQKHGQGIFTTRYGNKYIGQFKDNLYNGYGTLTYANGATEKGLWKASKFLSAGQNATLPACPSNGTRNKCWGTFTYANGDIHTGTWQSGKKHGRGKLTYANGSAKEGIWVDDEWVRPKAAPSSRSEWYDNSGGYDSSYDSSGGYDSSERYDESYQDDYPYEDDYPKNVWPFCFD